jgi:hypothetical protein
MFRNPPELIESPGRAPTAAFDSVVECDIKRRAINTRLSTGQNFHVLLL